MYTLAWVIVMQSLKHLVQGVQERAHVKKIHGIRKRIRYLHVIHVRLTIGIFISSCLFLYVTVIQCLDFLDSRLID